MRDDTRAVHGPSPDDDGPLVTPIAQSTTFVAASQSELDDRYEGRSPGHIYTRYANPTVQSAAARVADLEGADACLFFATGMAAITTLCLALVSSGGRIVAVRETYGGTAALFDRVLPRLGISIDRFPADDASELATLLRERADLVYLESPTNPTLKLTPLADAAALARTRGAVSVVDSTFATPVNSRPLELGVDLVLHSVTKYLAGHSDVMGGAVAGARALVERIDATHRITGATMDPHAAFLVERGLKTLAVRVRRQNDNALAVARFLESHAKVARVHYPGLASHPQHELACAQMLGGFGGMVAFDLPGGRSQAYAFADALRLVRNAASLGSVESLVTIPVVQSHRALSDEELVRAGIAPGCVRISCGIEDAQDIVEDVEFALGKA